MNNYPLHEKLAAMKERRQAAQDMLDWLLEEKGYTLCRYVDDSPWPQPTFINRSRLMGEFLEIDPDELEAEKVAMLEALRAQQEQRP